MILRGRTRVVAIAVGLLCAALAAAWAGPGAREPGFTGWREVRTAHFVFVYEERDREAVREILSFAEDVYNDVTLFLDSAPREVRVVVRGRIDSANGYTAASPPHIVLYVAPPSEPLIGLDAASYLRLLLVHELTHFVNFQYDRGILSLGEKVFGPGVKEAEAVLYGYAMMEGIATVTETKFTDGGRGRNPFFELEPRGLVHDHAFFPLRRISYGSSFPPLDRVWLGGYLYARYLLDRYGPDVMRRIHASYAAAPLLGPWAAVRAVTGGDPQGLFQDMVRALENRYHDMDSITAGRQLSPAGVGDWFLPVVTEGGWFLYRRTQGETGAIVRRDPRTGEQRVLLETWLSDASSLTASKDGSRVVFATTEQTEGRSGPILLSDLYALDPSTRAVRRITVGAHLWQPRLSPDGSTLVAVQAVGAASRLVMVDGVSGKVTALYARAGATVATPAFSPDGSRVAFVLQAGGRNDIMVLAVPGTPAAIDDQVTDVNVDTVAALLPRGAGREYYPSFIDNDTVAFSSDRGSTLALYAVRLSGGEPTLLCQDPVGAWAGVEVGGDIVYGTWRSSGFTLMEKEAIQEAAPAVEEKPAVPPAPIPQMPSSARYIDWPRFDYWAPLPFYLSTIASGELVFAPGVLLGAFSDLETTSLTAAFSFRTDWLQPAIELGLETRLGTGTVSYFLSQGFTTSPSVSYEELQQQLAFSFPLVSTIAMRTTTSLIATTGIVDSLSRTGAVPFTFADGFNGSAGGAGLAFAHDLGVAAGLAFLRMTSGSDMDLFARNMLAASASTVIYPPVVSDTGMGAFTEGLLSFAFPSPVAHQVIKLGLKASYSTFPWSFVQVTNPRGDFDSVVQDLPGRTLLSLDYQFPIALLDAPLIYVLGLVALGGGIHIEAAADWSPSPAVLAMDPYLYAGMEMVFVFSTGEGTIPILLGASVRFDPRFMTPFDWATDIRPYIAISTDSFAGTGLARTGMASTLVRAR